MNHWLISVTSGDSVLACATCMGDAGSLTNRAAGYAIIFMLVMLAIVLGSLIKFMSKILKNDVDVSAPVTGTRPNDSI